LDVGWAPMTSGLLKQSSEQVRYFETPLLLLLQPLFEAVNLPEHLHVFDYPAEALFDLLHDEALPQSLVLYRDRQVSLEQLVETGVALRWFLHDHFRQGHPQQMVSHKQHLFRQPQKVLVFAPDLDFPVGFLSGLLQHLNLLVADLRNEDFVDLIFLLRLA